MYAILIALVVGRIAILSYTGVKCSVRHSITDRAIHLLLLPLQLLHQDSSINVGERTNC